jgi:hypothetical protein
MNPTQAAAGALGDLLPPLDLMDLANRSEHAATTQALYAGGSLLATGFLYRLVVEVYRLMRGQRHDFIYPLLHLIGFTALLAAYQPLVRTVVQISAELGLQLGNASALHDSFLRRMDAFSAYSAELRGPMLVGPVTMDALAIGASQGLCTLLYLAVQVAGFVVKTTQMVTLAAIVAFGPIVLGLASLAPGLHCLGIGWFWALVEISAWAFTMDIMLYVFSSLGQKIPKDFVFVEELVLCSVILCGLLSIASITRLVLRGVTAPMAPGPRAGPARSL